MGARLRAVGIEVGEIDWAWVLGNGKRKRSCLIVKMRTSARICLRDSGLLGLRSGGERDASGQEDEARRGTAEVWP